MIVGTWRSRVGSSFASSGGVIHLSSQIINHPQYNPRNEDNDVSILRLSTNIRYIPNTVSTASIAGPNYNVADNQIVWAIGWGRTQVCVNFYIIYFWISTSWLSSHGHLRKQQVDEYKDLKLCYDFILRLTVQFLSSCATFKFGPSTRPRADNDGPLEI